MKPGIFIESMTAADLLQLFLDLTTRINRLEEILTNDAREEFTLTELTKLKGYGKAQLKRIMLAKCIPFKYDKRQMVVSREDAARIKPKGQLY